MNDWFERVEENGIEKGYPAHFHGKFLWQYILDGIIYSD